MAGPIQSTRSDNNPHSLAPPLSPTATAALPSATHVAQVMSVWDFEAAVERRDSTGGTSKRSVLEQAAKLESWVAEQGEATNGAKRQKK